MIFAALALSVASLGLQEIPQQKLEPGQCVTILWSKGSPPLRFAMIDERSQTLLLRRNRRDVTLSATSPARYEGDGLKIGVDLSFRDTQGIADGAVIDSGAIEIATADGEALILPVGGIRACR